MWLSFSNQLPKLLILLFFVYLILSTIGLYGGGIVFNDVFDFEIDEIERKIRQLEVERTALKKEKDASCSYIESYAYKI